MHRYRVLRHRLLSAYRQKAVEELLRRIDLAGIGAEFREAAELYTRQNALDWQLSPDAADVIDCHAITMEPTSTPTRP